jgi:dTDP-4-dehydrorhamnose 3,5-epimerase-like enzyme
VTDRPYPARPVLPLPEIVAPDPEVSGRIVVLDCAEALPFAVRRVYWIHGMRSGEVRGAHGHRRLTQAVVAVTGRVRFELDDGARRSVHLLNRPDRYLIVPPGFWRDFTALEDGTTLLVLASDPFDEDDYIRDYHAFLRFRGRT